MRAALRATDENVPQSLPPEFQQLRTTSTRPLSGSRQNESVVQRTVVLPPHPYLFCGTLLPRRRLKLGYLVQEDGEQVRGGLVSGAAGLIGLHCLPK
jgi:hypothetical protein